MKKIILFLLLASFSFAQEISPYYPATQPEAYRGEVTQLTYYDVMYVQLALQGFVNDRLGMTLLDSDMNKTSATYKFQDRFSTGKLIINLVQTPINVDSNVPVIVQSVKISGSKDRVFSFFVNYWGTTINWDAKKSDVERRHMQDIVRLHFNGGNPYITVTNAAYKTPKDFEVFFNDLKSKQPK